jgi:imidazolonepropionase-like amidohydrolase
MGQILFVNVSVFDGSGAPSFLGEVLVQGNRIKAVAKGRDQIKADGADVVDGGGTTLMPGLTEAHAHLSFTNCDSVLEMGDLPIEEHTLLTARHAKLMLDCGFTSCFSAASAKPRLDIVIRNEINAGLLPGPRLRAASPEITASGGLGDVRQLHKDHHSTEIIADGPDELRRVVRMMVREGVDTIKINLSGDNWVRPGFSETVTYTDPEVAAAAEQAKELNVKLACHSHATRAIKLALKYDFDVLYHCEYADEEALDQMEAKKDTIFVAPTIGSSWAYTYEAERWGITKEIAERNGMLVTIERACDVYRKMRKRGIRALPGGDYGFAWNPIGNNARDLEHFVKLFDYPPAEVLRAATKYGGELMGMGNELGQIKEGYLADMLLVDGDVVADVKLLQDRNNLLMIMKDGVYHKTPVPQRRQHQDTQVAAE